MRFRHFPTIPAVVSNLAAISVSCNPPAAYSTIRALHILKRQLLSPRATFKHHALLLGELDPVTGWACHRDT
jgi:hypothetical protein